MMTTLDRKHPLDRVPRPYLKLALRRLQKALLESDIYDWDRRYRIERKADFVAQTLRARDYYEERRP